MKTLFVLVMIMVAIGAQAGTVPVPFGVIRFGDLELTSFSLSLGEKMYDPISGDFLCQGATAYVTVRNNSGNASGGFYVTVYSDHSATAVCGEAGMSQKVGFMLAGASRTLTFPLLLGLHGTCRGFVDSTCVVRESSESDNQATRGY